MFISLSKYGQFGCNLGNKYVSFNFNKPMYGADV
jgi:hypothetical protein